MTARFGDADHDRFSVWLRARAEPAFTSAVDHEFVEEVGTGALSDDVFRDYLVQDYAFLSPLIRLVGHAIGEAPTATARRELAEALAVLTGSEDAYFERAFDALGVPERDRVDPTRGTVTEAFDDLLVRAGLEGGFEESTAVLTAAEWIYLAWADRAAAAGEADRWYLVEWIDMHRGPDFEAYVSWLRGTLDRSGPTLSPRREERVARLFRRTVTLEVAFFDQAYGSDRLSGGDS